MQEVLTDKRSRGAFGEVQLAGLVRNVMPEGSFRFQHTLSTGARVDCLLSLPEPTGNVPIDAKFPLESFQAMMDNDLPETDRARAQRQFRTDIKKHVNDIADKYLIPDETAEGANPWLDASSIHSIAGDRAVRSGMARNDEVGWPGAAGSYVVTIGATSSAVSGTDPAVPTATASVGGVTVARRGAFDRG